MSPDTPVGSPGRFPATRRSVLLAARDANPEVRRAAFGALAESYWKPVYKYLRAQGKLDAEDSRDLTQAFFAQALEKGTFGRYDPGKARFRTFLRLCLDGFVANERKAAGRLKRGGGSALLSLDFEGAEEELAHQLAPQGTVETPSPEEYFHREWVRALFTRAVETLRERCAGSGRGLRFTLFERYDLEGSDSGDRPTYAALATEHGVTPEKVTNELSAARRELRAIVLETLRELTGNESELRAEAREVLGVDLPMTFLSDAVLDHLREAVDLPDLAGTPYEVVGTIGRGGMATVYLARDRELDREVALKVVDGPEGTGDAAARAFREAHILARLEHPGIVPVHDVGTLPDGRVWYVMKRVRGRRFDEFARTVPRAERLRAFLRICEAVAFAHAHGVIHRDLKPENVMVGPFGEVLVMDWGVAKTGEGEAHGTILGTPGWMAPEQERGEVERIDARTDIWGLGAILGFLLAGEEPVPRPLDAIRQRAMAAEPDDRYPTVDALAADLALYLDGLPVAAYREGPMERISRFVRRHRIPILLILAYLLMRVVLLFVFRR